MGKIILWICNSCLIFNLISCKDLHTEKRLAPKSYDTLTVVHNFLSENDRSELLNKFYIDFGIVIPKYYNVTDSFPIDLDEDELIDTLVLLTPVIFEDVSYIDYLKAESPKRILVEVLNKKAGSKIRNVYNNLASNVGGVLSKYAGIYKTKQGFEMHYQSGSRYSWSFVVEFSTHYPDSIFLVRQEKICSFASCDIKQEQLFDKASVSVINVGDSIDNNCNCDAEWEKLDKTVK